MIDTPDMYVSYNVNFLTAAARDHWDNQLDQAGGIRPDSVGPLEAFMIWPF